MLSDRGRMRGANQDACAMRPERGVYVVCDGMGGAAAGEVASGLAAETFLRALCAPAPQPSGGAERKAAAPALDGAGGSNEAGPQAVSADPAPTRLRQAIHAANDAVFRHSCKSAGLRGMGTTLVGALFDESDDSARFWLAHVGDSRCYRLRGRTLGRLTEDHSLVEEQVRAGTLSRVEAEVSPIRNIITRAVGTEAEVEPEIVAHVIEPGDVYLLATDGLTRELDDAKIACVLNEVLPVSRAANPHERLTQAVLEAACQALIDSANAQGGGDNITVLLIGCV